MDFEFKCPNCQADLNVDSSLIGMKVGCPFCNEMITVPSPHELVQEQKKENENHDEINNGDSRVSQDDKGLGIIFLCIFPLPFLWIYWVRLHVLWATNKNHENDDKIRSVGETMIICITFWGVLTVIVTVLLLVSIIH